MELQDEKREEVYRYTLNCTTEEEEVLRKMAIKRFAKDRQAQLEYAVKSVITETIDMLALDNLSKHKDR
ncbi:MAG: hypothetical protein WC905_01455 [Patescibacteria group bacterium]|jgi:hypothetical protein